MAAKLNWLFGLVRAYFSYPDPGTLKVKALCFTLFASGREETGKGKKTKASDKGKTRRRGRRKEKSEEEKSEEEKSEKEKSEKEKFEKEKSEKREAEQPEAFQGASPKEMHQRETHKKETLQKETPPKEASQEELQKERRQNSKPQKEEETAAKAETIKSETIKAEKRIGTEKSSEQKTEEARGNPFEKLLYTIRRICDKIKSIRENIAHYQAILTDEDTKGLVNHAFMRIGKILKSIRPRKLKADILFGTGSPDTTGYAFAIYGMLCARLGNQVLLTPDFERAVLEGELYAAGHITVFKLLWNGLRVALDKRLWELMAKLKNEDN